METRLVLVALVTLALGCGETQGVTGDAGGDAEALDLGGLDVAVDDAGSVDADVEEDAGWCVSEQCIQRLNYFGTCMEIPRTDFPCDDGEARTYDDTCNAVGECVGTACECDEALACCDGCTYMPPGTACTTLPPLNNPATCTANGPHPMTLCNGPPITP